MKVQDLPYLLCCYQEFIKVLLREDESEKCSGARHRDRRLSQTVALRTERFTSIGKIVSFRL